MSTVTVTSKLQVVITYGSGIELIPIQPMTALKGLFRGIDTAIDREGDRL